MNPRMRVEMLKRLTDQKLFEKKLHDAALKG
jgi:hypothetical protein